MTESPSVFLDVLLRRLGSAPEKIVPGEVVDFKVKQGRKSLEVSAILFENQQAGFYHCAQRSLEGAWFVHQDVHADSSEADILEGRRLFREFQQSRLRRRWNEWSPIQRTDPFAGFLLRHRLLGSEFPSLRYREPSDADFAFEREGCPVAPVLDAGGTLRAVARIEASEHRIDMFVEKKRWGSDVVDLDSCSIVLFGLRHSRLGVAEGVEAALAAYAITGIPTVAVRDLNNMTRWECPRDVEHVTVFTFDHISNITAAHTLAAALETVGRQCEVRTIGRQAPPLIPLRRTWCIASTESDDE